MPRTSVKPKNNSSGKSYDADFLYHFFEGSAYRIFGPLFVKLPFSHMFITVAGFPLFGLPAVYFFTLGTHFGYLIGLALAYAHSVFDWMDGFVAKARGINSITGAWLDGALDVIWQNLLVAGLVLGVYNSKNHDPLWVVIGLASFVSLVVANNLGNTFRDKFDFKFRSTVTDFRNEITRNKKSGLLDHTVLQILAPTHFIFNFLFTIRYQLVVGGLLNRMDVVLISILIAQTIRASSLFFTYALYMDRFDRPGRPMWVVVRALVAREVK